MKRKFESNTKFLARIMEFGCPTGVLIQPFVLIALEEYAKEITATDLADLDNGLIDGAAWKRTAQWVLEELEARQ